MNEKKDDTQGNVLIEKQDSITMMTLNRPEALNAFTKKILNELGDAVDDFDRDPSQRVAVITGAGEKAFCTGADIQYIKEMNHEETIEWCMTGNRILNKMTVVPKAVIAMVNGYALGGGFELALACDFRIAAEGAMFGLPESTLGWLPGWGGSKRLASLIGMTRAKEMLMFGNRISAEEALKIGLVNKVVPKSSLLGETKEFALNLASKNPLSIAAIKFILSEYGGIVKEEAHFLEALSVDFLSKSEYGQKKIEEFEERMQKKK